MNDSRGVLAGRVIVAVIADPRLAATVVDHATAAAAMVAIACPDVAVVRSLNESDSAGVVAFATDLAGIGAKERFLAHVEQRLGPIDAVITATAPDISDGLIAAAKPDMAARGVAAVARIGATPADDAAARAAFASLADQLRRSSAG